MDDYAVFVEELLAVVGLPVPPRSELPDKGVTLAAFGFDSMAILLAIEWIVVEDATSLPELTFGALHAALEDRPEQPAPGRSA